jgi:acyl carrier protein
MTAKQIEDWLAARAADLTQSDQADVDRQLPLTSLGFDSLSLFSVTGDLAALLGRDLPASLLWEYPTIHQIANHLAATEPPAPEPAGTSKKQLLKSRPLTFAQERIWQFYERGKGDLNLGLSTYELKGPLDVWALQHAFAELMRRHEILRTTMGECNNQPVQRAHPVPPEPLEWMDLSHYANPAGEADQMEEASRNETVDLETGPLFRAQLLRLSEYEHRLLLRVHHVIYDVRSYAIIYEEISALYGAFSAGEPSPLDELGWQIGDYAAWQRNRLRRDGEIFQKQLAFWLEHWGEEIPPPLKLPFLREKPAKEAQAEEGILSCDVPKMEELRELSRTAGTTLHTTLFTAFALTLCRCTGQQEMVIGSYVSDRNSASVKNLIGFFVNLIALRVQVCESESFMKLLEQSRDLLSKAAIHQELPFEELRASLEAAGRKVPMIDVIFQTVRLSGLTLKFPGLEVTQRSQRPREIPWGFMLTLNERPARLEAQVKMNPQIYDPLKVSIFLREYVELLNSIATGQGI